jgi:hypothetical protein
LNKYTTPPKEAKTPQTPKLKPVYGSLSIPTFSPLPKCAVESEKKAEIQSLRSELDEVELEEKQLNVRLNVFGEKEFFNPNEEKVLSPNTEFPGVVATQVVLTPEKVLSPNEAPSEKHNYSLASPVSYAQKQLSLSPCSVAVEPSSSKEEKVRTVEDDCERLFALLLKISSPKKDKPTLINQARLSLGFQPRTKCKTCQTTWNCKPTLECQTCKRGFRSWFVQNTTHQRCQGCLHVLRKTTPTGSHMCGFCSNVYDSFYREGVCNENVPLATEMKKSHWYVEGVDRMRPDIYEYYRSPVKKGISLEHENEDESEDEFRVARKPQRQTMILVD